MKVLLVIFKRRGFSSSFQDLTFHRSLLSEKNFSKYENSNFSLVSQTQSILSITSKPFLSSNSIRHTFSPWIAKTYFHPFLMEDILESNETCFFILLNENPIIWRPVPFFSFWSNFHCSHMILDVHHVCQVWEFKNLFNFDSHEKRKSSRKLLKIHNQASIKFSSLLIFKLSSCDSSPSLITSRWWIFKSW